jgi:phage I-like protein
MSVDSHYKDGPVTLVNLAGQDTGEGLKEVVLVPWGVVESRKGVFVVDDEAASTIVADFDKHETPVLIDYEHQSMGAEHAAPDGRAPAAGFVHQMFKVPGIGIKGLVEWNPRARDLIRAGEYRYLSPVVVIDGDTRRLVGMPTLAIVNQPAIPGMQRIAASTRETKETIAMGDEPRQATGTGEPNVLLGQIVEMLGAEPGKSITLTLQTIKKKIAELLETVKGQGEGREVDEEETVAESMRAMSTGDEEKAKKAAEHITARQIDDESPEEKVGRIRQLLESKGIKVEGSVGLQDVLNLVITYLGGETTAGGDAAVAASARELLGLAADASEAEVVLAMKTRDTSGAGTELATMRAAEAERIAEERVDKACRENKINPHDTKAMSAARALALEQPDRFDALMVNYIPHVPPGRTTPPTHRQVLMSRAASEYGMDAALQKATTAEAYVDMKLRDAGVEAMTDDEKREVVTLSLQRAAPAHRPGIS